jgi:hypothetical protein
MNKPMTTKQADRLIASGQSVLVGNQRYAELFTIMLVARDKRTVTTADGGRFMRDELVIINPRVVKSPTVVERPTAGARLRRPSSDVPRSLKRCELSR